MSLYKIRIDTANLVEAPPYLRPVDNRPLFLGPGTKATVQITLYGNQGVSQPITVSGATGKVLYGEMDTGAIPLVNGYIDREPFCAGKSATIALKPEPPLDVGRVEKIVISHNRAGPGPEWFPLQIKLADGAGQIFVFPCAQWLVGDELSLRGQEVVGVFNVSDFDAAVFDTETAGVFNATDFDAVVFDDEQDPYGQDKG